jgi:YD repeat-containing protein
MNRVDQEEFMSLAEHARGRVAWHAAACAVWMVLILCIAPVAQAEGVVSKSTVTRTWWSWAAGTGLFSSYQAACQDAMAAQQWSGAVTYFVDSPTHARCYATTASGDLLLSPSASMNFLQDEVQACPPSSTEVSSTDCNCDEGFGVSAGGSNACLPKADVPRADNPPRSCPIAADPAAGNPIFSLRGVKREVVDTDLRVGRLSLQFTYDSTAKIPRVPQVLSAGYGRQQRGGVLGGPLWFSNLNRRISTQTRSADAFPTLPVPTVASRGSGRSVSYTQTSNAPLVSEPGNADRLAYLPGGSSRYSDSESNTQENYDQTGRITSMMWIDGTRIGFTYSEAGTPGDVAPNAGLLIRAGDNLGRSLNFTYAIPKPGYAAQLYTVTDEAGRVTTLGYDAQNNLSSITWPDRSVRTFLYDNAALPWALTGISDEAGKRYSTFGYDSAGRAISTEHAGGVERYSVVYATPPSIQVTTQSDGAYVVYFEDWNLPQGVVLTGPSGSSTELGATSLNGKNHLTGRTQAAGAGCGASTSGQAYDANGNLASRDDFNGTRSCYANDLARNLQVASVSGLSQGQACAAVTQANASLPAGARKTSTQWHPDWSLPSKVAESGQITTSVYNGQPDPLNDNAIASCEPGTAPLLDGKPIAVLCKQAVQATTDADGHLGFGATLQAGAAIRISTWTYNESGQVLTAKTTRGGVTVTTSSTYFADTNANHTKGDLATTTDAAGKVTVYNKYTRAGQLLQSTDSDGVVTVNTYDLRQRLLTTTVGGETTTYTYDPVGQLTQVTEQDGSWIAYEYDDARRQKAVMDSSGNRIEYVLDNAGNSTGQTVKDPTGSLKRNMARVMDALGRAQENSGRE